MKIPIKEVFTKKDFFQVHAPQFNFELNADQLIEKALERGFIIRATKGFGIPCKALYRYNPDYKHDQDETDY
jgi:hypothetical protein